MTHGNDRQVQPGKLRDMIRVRPGGVDQVLTIRRAMTRFDRFDSSVFNADVQQGRAGANARAKRASC